MRKALTIICMSVICLLFLPACWNGGGLAPTGGLDAEAKQEAEKFWAGQLTRCGGSYYRETQLKNGDKEFFEIKEPEARLAPRKVTDADRLNGVEWLGMVALEAKAVRVWGSRLGHWEAWSNGAGRLSDREYPMKKVNGRWDVDTKKGGVFDEVIRYVPVDCSEIPQ
jgi:hypothetical protein